MSNSANPIVIIDNGSGMTKAGFAGEDAPQAVFPAIVGRPRTSSIIGSGGKTEYIGDEALKMMGVLNLEYPIKTGVVENWDDMEKVWHHCFNNELRIDPTEAEGVFMTEAPRQIKINREKMVQVMFETFGFKNVYVAIQAVMSLYSAGRTTGLVVDSGDGVTHTVPVFEGFSIPSAVERMEIAGRVMTEYMQRLLQSGIGESFDGGAGKEIVRAIKEKVCYVAQNYEEEKAAAQKSSEHDMPYELPDKSIITVPATVRMSCPELLFNPQKNGMECKSIQDLTWASVQKSDIDTRRDLCKNIIMSGGSSMYDGIADRLKSEIVAMAPAASDIRIIAAADRKYAVFRGASTLASLSTFHSSWISKEDYEDHGAAIVHRKCA